MGDNGEGGCSGYLIGASRNMCHNSKIIINTEITGIEENSIKMWDKVKIS